MGGKSKLCHGRLAGSAVSQWQKTVQDLECSELSEAWKAWGRWSRSIWAWGLSQWEPLSGRTAALPPVGSSGWPCGRAAWAPGPRWHPALAPRSLSGPASRWLRADLGPRPVNQDVGSGHHSLLVFRGWRSTCEVASSGPRSSWTRPRPGSCSPDPRQPRGPRLRTQPRLGSRQESCSAILAADRGAQKGAGPLHRGGRPPATPSPEAR